MITCNAYPAELKVFLNHVYEYKKGVRNMVLYTTNKKYEEFAVSRLNSQNIDYCIQPIGCNKINLFFGRRECIEVIQSMTSRPLNDLAFGGFYNYFIWLCACNSGDIVRKYRNPAWLPI